MLNIKKFIALDLEFNQPSRKIIQVGVCRGTFNTPDSDWSIKSWLISIDEPLRDDIVALTGITDEILKKDGVSLSQMAAELSTWLDSEPHFVNPITWGSGDLDALKTSLAEKEINFPHFGRRILDVKTLHVFNRLASDKSTAGGLKSVMAEYSMKFEGIAHRADVDAYNTLRLFFKMLRKQKEVNHAVKLLAEFT